MIRLTDINGRKHLLSPHAIERVTEVGVSGKWHGVNTYVRTFYGSTIEARESVDEIEHMLGEAEEKSNGQG